MKLPAYEVSTHAKTAVPPLVLDETRSLGALVPVATTPEAAIATTTACDRAVALLEQARTTIYEVTESKGPTARPNPVDAWLAGRHDSCGPLGVLSGVLSLTGAFLSVFDACVGGGRVALLAGAAAALFAGTSYVLVGAPSRLDRAAKCHDKEKLDSQDVERMLAPYVSATPEERAALDPFLKAELASLDNALTAKAALTRDGVLSLPASSAEEQPQLRRGMTVARAILALRGRTWDGKPVEDVERAITEALPEERQQIAATLLRTLYKGERATFESDVQSERRLYDVIDRAQRGEPPRGRTDG